MICLDKARIVIDFPLQDSSRVVLEDMFLAPATIGDEQVEKNIYRLATNGDIAWQINAPQGAKSRTPFTGMYWSEKQELIVYRWDGAKFFVDLETGATRPWTAPEKVVVPSEVAAAPPITINPPAELVAAGATAVLESANS
ncbi:MAG TPA: hypothetical protein VHU84_12360 [Lacipirellulaceae bacterium]|jgi:hypothetical protein|nr:hypothetical protein [Lacipirellulaceae bacterium]